MLVNRFVEIENFKPQPYWELQTTYRNTLFNYEDGRFLKQEDGQVLADKVKESDFEIVSVTKKKGKEYAPKLFDLTGLQVYCNNKFGFSADETLKMVQKLYEMKVVTYPRVDTTFLPNDVYPKIAGILSKLTNYSELTQPLLGSKIKKSKRVFDDKKVTDHHAIIPTGIQGNLQYNQQQVYDIITRRFIGVFYPDSDVSNTSVIGKAADVPFKTTGKEIITKGWRVAFETKNVIANEMKQSANRNEITSSKSPRNDKSVLPSFIKGEKGAHEPSFLEKETKPPRNFTEASLLRATPITNNSCRPQKEHKINKHLSCCTQLDSVAEVRVLGAIGVVELKEAVDMANIQKRFVEHGVWVRPFGKLVYVMPPFIMTDAELSTLCNAIYTVISQYHKTS